MSIPQICFDTDSTNSETLADIGLNALGLILIILLIYIIAFKDSSKAVHTQAAAISRLEQSMEQMTRSKTAQQTELAEIKQCLVESTQQSAQEDAITGLWVLQLHQTELFSRERAPEPINWLRDFNVCLSMKKGKVKGCFFGHKILRLNHPWDADVRTPLHFSITGHVHDDGYIHFNFLSMRINARLIDDSIVGAIELDPDQDLRPNCLYGTGTVRGRRAKPGDFRN